MATVFTQKSASLTGGAGSDVITGSNDTIAIGAGAVTLSDATSSQNNTFVIGGGTDTLIFYGAADQISVAAGTDTITLRGTNESLTVADGGKNSITM